VFVSIKSSPSHRRDFSEFKYHGNALHASQLSGQSSFIGIARLSLFTTKDDIRFTLPLGGSKPRDEASGRAAIEIELSCPSHRDGNDKLLCFAGEIGNQASDGMFASQLQTAKRMCSEDAPENADNPLRMLVPLPGCSYLAADPPKGRVKE
jgi:hypothetical protein